MWLICFAIKDIITVECDLKTDIKIQYDVRFDAIVPTAVHIMFALANLILADRPCLAA